MGKNSGSILADQAAADGGFTACGFMTVKKYLGIKSQGPVILQAVTCHNVGDIGLLRHVKVDITIDSAIGQKVYDIAKWRYIVPLCRIYFEKEMIDCSITNRFCDVHK